MIFTIEQVDDRWWVRYPGWLVGANEAALEAEFTAEDQARFFHAAVLRADIARREASLLIGLPQSVVQIVTNLGALDASVLSECGDLVVHEGLSHSGYSITHRPSGMKIGPVQPCFNLERAVAVAIELWESVPQADWDALRQDPAGAPVEAKKRIASSRKRAEELMLGSPDLVAS